MIEENEKSAHKLPNEEPDPPKQKDNIANNGEEYISICYI